MGAAPVFSFDEFRSRVPDNQADWKIVPVGERPFPAALQGEGFRAEPDPSALPLPIAGIGGGLVLAALAWRRRKRSAAAKAAKAAPVAATAQ